MTPEEIYELEAVLGQYQYSKPTPCKEHLRFESHCRDCCAYSNLQEIVGSCRKLLTALRSSQAENKLLKATKHPHHLCPDCRDKCRDEPCLRCQNRKLQAEVERLRGRFDGTEIYTLYSMAREKVSEAEKMNDANATAYYERIWTKLGDMLEEARAGQQSEGG